MLVENEDRMEEKQRDHKTVQDLQAPHDFNKNTIVAEKQESIQEESNEEPEKSQETAAASA